MPSRSFRFALVGLLLLAVAPSLLSAQTQTGRVTGRVIDAGTGRGLPGAQVSVQGTQLRATAGVDGRYAIAGVPAGARTLTANLLGYSSKTVTGVNVAAGRDAAQDITLSSAAIAIEALTVTAERERGSVSVALDEQRTATGVVSAVSAEQIARSPDGDAAAAIRRVSGVTVQDGRYVVVRGLSERYTTTTLNGSRIPSPEPERRVVPLDLFPSGLLEGISTAKTFTPNLSGDFSGAVVNIRTREYPRRPTFTFSSSFSANPAVVGQDLPLAPSSQVDWLAFGAGEREVPGAVPGDFTGLGQEDFNRIASSFRNVWSPQDGTGAVGGSFAASLGGTSPVLGRDLGYLASLSYSRDYDVREDFVRAQALLTGEGGEVAEIDRFEGTQAGVSVLWGGLLNLSAPVGRGRISFNNNYNRSADTEGVIERGVLESDAISAIVNRVGTVERSVRSNQLQGEHQLADRHRVEWSLTSSGVSRAEPDRSEFVYETTTGTPRWYFNDSEGAVRTFGDLDENALEGRLDYTLNLGPAGRHSLSLGGLFRDTRREAFNRAYSITAIGGSLSQDELALDPEEIFDGRFSQPGDAVFRVSELSVGGSYEVDDLLGAGYAMADLGLTDGIRLIGGARVERSEVGVAYTLADRSSGLTEPAYTDVLPAVALNVDLSDEQKLRFSASQTLSRPEYRELFPGIYREVLGGDLVRGNPELERSLIQNYDARWEWYPAADEVLSVGFFAKRFQDPIERVYLQTSGSRLVTFTNAESALNYGVELEARKTLGMLGERGEDFTAFANATFVRSDVEVVGEDADRPMVGQSPYVLNAGLTFAPADGGTTATVLYNVFGKRIVSAGEGLLPDVYEQPRHVLDIAFRRRITGSLSLKLDAENLLDAKYEQLQGSVTRESYRTGRSFGIGLTWRR